MSDTRTSTLQDIRTAFGLLDRTSTRRFMRLVVIAIVASILEAMGVTIAFGLIKVILEPETINSLPWLKDQLAAWDMDVSYGLFIVAALSMGVFFFLKNCFLVYAAYAQQRFTFGSSAYVACVLLARYLKAPFETVFNRNSADMMVGVNQASYTIASRLFLPTIVVVTESLIIIAVLAVLLHSEPMTTVASAVFIGVFMTVYYLGVRRLYLKWGEQQLALDKLQTKCVYESLGSLKEVKVLNRENYFLERFRDYRTRHAQVAMNSGTANALPRLVTETILIWAIALVIVLALSQDRPALSIISTLGLFAFAGFRIMPSMNRITLALTTLRHGKSYLDRVVDDFKRYDLPPDQPEANESVKKLVFSHSITAENLSYTYPGADGPAVHGVGFTLEKGRSLGIVGGTGAGKTTLIDIILGLLQPAAGSITLDSRSLNTNTAEWKRSLGYVPQDISLIDDSLRRNIALGIADAEIDAQSIDRAVTMAALEKVVEGLPNGLDTVVGERGIRLSGGQRQRIGIARALYHDPQILVMDEATSSLDTTTEQEIINSVERLRGQKTVIIIAHRLSTVRRCDKLLFLRSSELVDTGSFDEIRDRNPEFARMVHLAEVTGTTLDETESSSKMADSPSL